MALFAVAVAACSAAPPIPTTAQPTRVASVDGACPVTIPAAPYVARAPYLARPPAYYDAVWYGTDDLWTMLDPDGATYGEKTFWWSRNFDIEAERQPSITVTGRRLDAPGSFVAGNPGTHAYADFGTSMLVGAALPAPGCWEITAHYKGAELSYVVGR